MFIRKVYIQMDTLVNLSRYISFILRHRPDTIGLSLDKHGYIDVQDLINGINKNSVFNIDLDILKFIVETDNKKRYSFSEDGTKIRANQGHSVKVDLGLKEVKPPSILYHGTGEKYLDSILKEGLKSKSRMYVHLSSDVDTAISVGKRHGEPIILNIDTNKMLEDGHKFYLSENGIFLTESVPVEYLNVVCIEK